MADPSDEALEFLAVAQEGAKRPLVAVDLRARNLGTMGVRWVETSTALSAIDDVISTLQDEIKRLREALEHSEAEARRFAEFYPEASDGRNTLVILADKINALSSTSKGVGEL